MPNGSGITQEDVQTLLDQIVEEQDALLKKLPLWKKITLGIVVTATLSAAILACIVLSGLTGPAFLLALALCIAAILSFVALLLQVVGDWFDESGEAKDINRKMRRLERMREQLGH